MKRLHYLMFFVFCAMLISPLMFPSRKDKNVLAESIISRSLVQTVGASEDPNWPEKQPKWSYQAVGTVNVVALSSNGAYVLIGTSDGYVCLFNTTSNIPLDAVKIGGSVSVLDVSYYGDYVAAASGKILMVFRITNNLLLYTWNFTVSGREVGIYSLAFSFDGRYLAVGTWAQGYYGFDSTYVHLFEITTGRKLWSCQISSPYWSNEVDYVSVDISSDGNYIVAGSTYSKKVYLFSQLSSSPIYSYDTGASINSVSITGDGRYFVAGGNRVYYFSKDVIVPIWSRDIGGTVTSVSISSNAAYIVATRETYIYLLKDDNSELWNYDIKSKVNQALISKNGNYMLVSGGNFVYLFSRTEDGNASTPTLDPIWSYNTKSTVRSISISANGRYSVIAAGGKIFYFDALHKADLALKSLTLSDETPNEDDIITITATIHNIGSHKSYFANVSFYDGKSLIGKVQIDPLAPGLKTNASINSYVCLPGYRTIKVIVDEENEVFESNKTNNQLVLTIYVNARPSPVVLNNPTDATPTSIRLSWSKNVDQDLKSMKFMFLHLLMNLVCLLNR